MTKHTYILVMDRVSCDWATETEEGFDAVMPLLLAYDFSEAVLREPAGVIYRREIYSGEYHDDFMGVLDGLDDEPDKDLFLDGLPPSDSYFR